MNLNQISTAIGTLVLAAGSAWAMIEVRAREVDRRFDVVEAKSEILHPDAVPRGELALLRELSERDHKAIMDHTTDEVEKLRVEIRGLRELIITLKED